MKHWLALLCVFPLAAALSSPASAKVYALGTLTETGPSDGFYDYGVGQTVGPASNYLVPAAVTTTVKSKKVTTDGVLSFADDYTFTLPYKELVEIGFSDGDHGKLSLYSSSTEKSAASVELLKGATPIAIDALQKGLVPTFGVIPSPTSAFTPDGVILGAGAYTLAFGGYLDNPASTKQTFQYSGAITVSAVPELSTWLMMAIGFSGLGFAGFRNTKKGRTAFAAA